MFTLTLKSDIMSKSINSHHSNFYVERTPNLLSCYANRKVFTLLVDQSSNVSLEKIKGTLNANGTI